MHFFPEDLLSALLEAAPRPTAAAPGDVRGLYGLVDHHGDLRYIGSTSSAAETLYKRIHQRHRTGSENTSHYFSAMYNTGRMWRDRTSTLDRPDGDIAKALRNEFVIDHCRAVWVSLPDTADIARLEAEVLSLAPDHAVAWNRRGMPAYDEPCDLVDATLRRLGWGADRIAALERQRQRFGATTGAPPAPQPLRREPPALAPKPLRQAGLAPFPKGPFRFFALDVETANNDRASICQIGIACVRPDNSIETWVTYVDPQVERWLFTSLHGISAHTVQGAPTFGEVLPILREALEGRAVWQHSGFDRSAVAAVCARQGLPAPAWDWRDSVQLACATWPDLKARGGYGLASLKAHLGLVFRHHDAGEDARAAAEVVLRAEGAPTVGRAVPAPALRAVPDNDDFPLIEDCGVMELPVVRIPSLPAASPEGPHSHAGTHIGTAQITQGNLDHHHIYLRSFFDRFPADAIGGSSIASAASREIAVDWGGATVVMTDLDGAKRFFRKRGWIREFFARSGARVGDRVIVEQTGPYSYRVALQLSPARS